MSSAQKVTEPDYSSSTERAAVKAGEAAAMEYTGGRVGVFLSGLTAYRKALRAAPTPDAHSEVGVEALEWVEDEIGWWSAQPDAMFRGYELRITDRGAVRVRRGNEDWFASDGTADEAKAAAQADFAQRVQSCLTAGVVKAEPVAITDEMAFAAMKEADDWDLAMSKDEAIAILTAALASKPEGER